MWIEPGYIKQLPLYSISDFLKFYTYTHHRQCGRKGAERKIPYKKLKII